MANDQKNLIKDYKHWTLSVAQNQCYLGYCIIWCKREDAEDLADATGEELAELGLVIREAQEMLKRAFNPDWFNYAFLGNSVRHLHCHLVPRYSTIKNFVGMNFEDALYPKGLAYRIDPNFVTPPEVLQGIISKLTETI